MNDVNEQAKKQSEESTDQNINIDINADDSISGTSHLNEPVATEPDIEKLKDELNSMQDKFLRKVAEFDNFKKRSQKERIELIQTAGKEIIIDLLDVLDDCTRAEKQIAETENADHLKEGILLVFGKLRSILYSKGLKPMECINQEFNPDLHEAISEIKAPAEDMKGKVVDEVIKGYYLNDKIIRHAKVVVGK